MNTLIGPARLTGKKYPESWNKDKLLTLRLLKQCLMTKNAIL